MGCFGSKQKISKVDLEYLKKHTRYDEATIKEWFKGFRVSLGIFIFSSTLMTNLFTPSSLAGWALGFQPDRPSPVQSNNSMLMRLSVSVYIYKLTDGRGLLFFLWPIVDVVEPFIFSTLAGPPHCDNNGATVVFDVVACFKGRLKLSAQQLDKTPPKFDDRHLGIIRVWMVAGKEPTHGFLSFIMIIPGSLLACHLPLHVGYHQALFLQLVSILSPPPPVVDDPIRGESPC